MILKFSRRKSQVHGWGLFADEFISSGEIIEKLAYVKLDDLPYPLIRYRFGCKETGNVVVFGYANLINGSLENPNVKWEYNDENDLFYVYSIKDIQKGEELFLEYL